MYSVLKDGFSIHISKTPQGVTVSIKNGNSKNIFGLVDPGNIFLLIDNKWNLLDTSTILSDKEFEDFMDKATFELVQSLMRFHQKLKLREDEQVFLQTLIYDVLKEQTEEWISEDVTSFSLEGNKIKYIFRNGEYEYENMPGENVKVKFFTKSQPKITLPPLINPILTNPLDKPEVIEKEKRETVVESEGLSVPLTESNYDLPESSKPKLPLIGSPRVTRTDDRSVFELTTEEMSETEE